MEVVEEVEEPSLTAAISRALGEVMPSRLVPAGRDDHPPGVYSRLCRRSYPRGSSPGDAVFFNPALFHGAGTNHSTDVRRTANLLQVSSAFGRAMETVDRPAMCRALFPVLLALQADGARETTLRNIVAASAEGYAFPTNLDHDQPIDGLTPPTQADLLRQALRETWDKATLHTELDAQSRRRDVPSASGLVG